jgi:hypothetical protein
VIVRREPSLDERFRADLARERLERRGWASLNERASLDTLTRSWVAGVRGLGYVAPRDQTRGARPRGGMPLICGPATGAQPSLRSSARQAMGRKP